MWVLDWISQECNGPEDHEPPLILGVFSDRANIARLFIRGLICHANEIKNIHWYEDVRNTDLSQTFEGWNESEDENYAYSLRLMEIDDVG